MRSPDQAAPFPAWGGARLTRPPRPTPNELPQDPTRRHRGGDRRRGRWGWERHTTARPRAPEGQPGALQEHRKRPRQSQRSCNAREGSTTGRRDSTPTAAEGGGPARRQPQEAKARGACCVRGPRRPPPNATRQTAGAGQQGQAGFRTPAPPNAPLTGGDERQGAPAGGTRRTGPTHHEWPPLARRGSVPARESTTSPHRSGKATPERGRSVSQPQPPRRPASRSA